MANLGVVVLAKMLAILFLCMLVNSPCGVQAQIPCNTVDKNLSPCFRYIQNGQGEPPQCCENVRYLAGLAKTPEDRQSVCNCLKKYASAFNDRQMQNAAALPSHCGVNTRYTIQRNMDCSRVD